MFCTKCGMSISENSKFCQKCGSPVKPVNTAPANVAANNAPQQPAQIQPDNAPQQPAQMQPDSAPQQTVRMQPDSAPQQPAQMQPDSAPQQPAQMQPDSAPQQPAQMQPGSAPQQSNISALPEKMRHRCAVCDQETPYADMHVSVVSGIQINIGKGRDKKDLYHKEPNMTDTAPICSRCNEEGVGKIKKMRPVNCVLAILFWPIGIAMLIGGFVLFFSDYLWIPLGSIMIKPYIFGVILCIPGIAVISLAVRFGKRGFSQPERVLAMDAEKKLKNRVLGELIAESGRRDRVFAATMKEAANLQKQNAVARKACKYPSANPTL